MPEDSRDFKFRFEISGIKKLILEVRFVLRSLGVVLEGPTLMLAEISVVLNTSVPSRVLKKKHNAIAYDRDGPVHVFGDNKSVITSSQKPEATLS
jgi:hypothetical protein